MVSVSVHCLFYQPMDEKIKTWTLRFHVKENPNMEKALFDWPVVLECDVKEKYRLISRKSSSMKFFLPERSLNQLKATRVCIRSINRSNRSLSVRLLYLFCSGVFIARSYENRSMYSIATGYKTNTLFLSVFYSRRSQERRHYITSLWIYNLTNSSLTVSLQERLQNLEREHTRRPPYMLHRCKTF